MTRPADTTAIQEVRDRTRRIETRLTALVLRLGGETQAQKPEFSAGPLSGHAVVVVPSIHSTLKEILDSMPEVCKEPVDVYVGDRLVTTIVRN